MPRIKSTPLTHSRTNEEARAYNLAEWAKLGIVGKESGKYVEDKSKTPKNARAVRGTGNGKAEKVAVEKNPRPVAKKESSTTRQTSLPSSDSCVEDTVPRSSTDWTPAATEYADPFKKKATSYDDLVDQKKAREPKINSSFAEKESSTIRPWLLPSPVPHDDAIPYRSTDAIPAPTTRRTPSQRVDYFTPLAKELADQAAKKERSTIRRLSLLSPVSHRDAIPYRSTDAIPAPTSRRTPSRRMDYAALAKFFPDKRRISQSPKSRKRKAVPGDQGPEPPPAKKHTGKKGAIPTPTNGRMRSQRVNYAAIAKGNLDEEPIPQKPNPRKRKAAPNDDNPQLPPAKKHIGEKNVFCPECNMEQHRRTHLRTHQSGRSASTTESQVTPEEAIPQNPNPRKRKVPDDSDPGSPHVKKHTGQKDVFCPECNKAFTRKSNMEQHRRTHQNGRSASTPTAQATLPASPPNQDPRIAVLDSESATGKKYVFCPECNKSFTRKYNMEKHRRIHQRGPSASTPKAQATPSASSPQQNHICPECNKAFTRKDHMVRHRRIHQSGRSASTPKRQVISSAPPPKHDSRVVVPKSDFAGIQELHAGIRDMTQAIADLRASAAAGYNDMKVRMSQTICNVENGTYVKKDGTKSPPPLPPSRLSCWKPEVLRRVTSDPPPPRPEWEPLPTTPDELWAS